jgi:hypothetical protein
MIRLYMSLKLRRHIEQVNKLGGSDLQKSNKKNKKYMILVNNKYIHFGHIDYEHYKDQTPLKLYKHLDHNDKERRERYRKRHKKILLKDGSPAYLDKNQPAYYSYRFLW